MADEIGRVPRIAMRWSILFAASGMMWGVYFIYDVPASLSTPLQIHLGLSNTQYAYLVSSLYTAYAVPNFILPCLTGFAAQRYGEKQLLALCIGIAIFGQLLFSTAIAMQKETRIVLVISRVLIGIGSEVPGVIASDIVTRWFQDHTLALALAILLGINRLGSVATSVITPRLAEAYGVVMATWLSTGIALTVLITCGAYVLIMDRVVSKKESAPNYLDSIGRLPHIFWLLAIICVTTYGCVSPFNNSAQRFLASRFYGGNQSAAGLAVSIPNTLSAVLVLPFGLLLEHPSLKGRYSTSILSSSTLLLTGHILFLLFLGGAIFPLVLLGLANALYGVAFWPAVALSILNAPIAVGAAQRLLYEDSLQDTIALGIEDAPEENGIAAENIIDNEKDDDLVLVGYGVMTSFLNITLGIVPIILAVMENLAGYSGLEMVFVGLSTISVFAAARFVNLEK